MSESTSDSAARLRAAYKAKGWNARMISVRVGHFSCGAVHVTVRDPRVPFEEAERMARATAERLDRDSLTGEILNGGNIYVSVAHSNECKAVLARRHLAALEAAVVRLRSGSERLVRVAGTDWWVGADNGGYVLRRSTVGATEKRAWFAASDVSGGAYLMSRER